MVDIDYLESMALESADACRTIMATNGELIPMLLIRVQGELHHLQLPVSLLQMMNSPEGKGILFGMIAAIVEHNAADLAIWMAEAWECKFNEETKKRLSMPELERLAARGSLWLVENGFATRSEALSISAQTRERVVSITIPFMRFPGMPVLLGEQDVVHMAQRDIDGCNIQFFRGAA